MNLTKNVVKYCFNIKTSLWPLCLQAVFEVPNEPFPWLANKTIPYREVLPSLNRTTWILGPRPVGPWIGPSIRERGCCVQRSFTARFWQYPNIDDKSEAHSPDRPLSSPEMGHWGTCPLPLRTIWCFQLTLELHKVWRRLCAVITLSKHVVLNSSCGCGYMNLVRCIISRHFMSDKVSRSFAPLSHRILACTPLRRVVFIQLS